MANNPQFESGTFSRNPRISGSDPQFQGERFRSADDLYHSNMSAINTRLEKIENCVDRFVQIIPKIEHIHGFTVHAAPLLADKADVAKVKNEVVSELGPKIEERLKSSTFFAVVGLIIALATLGAALAAVPEFSAWAKSLWPHGAAVRDQPKPPPPSPAPPQPPA